MNYLFGFLYIKPRGLATEVPLIDSMTRRMTAAFRQAKEAPWAYFGVHTCVCGATSTNIDYRLPNWCLTNSLCIHYLAYHRPEVPWHQLWRVRRLRYGECEPTADELFGPDIIDDLRRKYEGQPPTVFKFPSLIDRWKGK